MPRYIDADALIRLIEIDAICYKPYSRRDAIACIKAINTADVVPKSEYDAVVSAVDNSTKEFLKLHDDYQEAKREVEKLQNELVIWKQNRFNLFQRLECYETARQKVAREIFEEIFDRLITSFPTSSFIDAPCTTENRLYSMIAKLKKKYQVETK